MHLIFGLLFRGKFWVQFILAAGLVWLGFFIQTDENNRQAARAALLEKAPPATVSIADTHPGAPSRVPVELSLTAQIATDHNTRLVTKTNFIKTGESQLFVLIDPTGDPNIARAAIVIDPDDRDAFVQWVIENTSALGSDQPITTINGLLEHSSDASHAREAMQNQGMTIADDLFFIEPFFKGRDAALTAIPNRGSQISWPFLMAAAVMALIGALKLRSAMRPNPAVPHPAPIVDQTLNQTIPAAPLAIPARPAKPAMTNSRKIMYGLGAVLLLSLITGQSWAAAILPLGFLGAMILVIRNGLRSTGKQLESVVDYVSTRMQPKDSPSPLVPAQSPAKAVAKDGGPIRSGFSFKDILPQPKRKAAFGPDPFERLAQQRQNQDRGSAKP